jgi:hypothetical protein
MTDEEREEREVAKRARMFRRKYEHAREAVTFDAGGDALKALENLVFHDIVAEGAEHEIIKALDALVAHFAKPQRRPQKRIFVGEFGYVPRQEGG